MEEETKKIDHESVIPKGWKVVSRQGDTIVCTRPDGGTSVLQDNSYESRTNQADAEAADINNIMKRYNYNQLPDVPAVVGEFSQITDYHEMALAVRQAEGAFQQLPGALRERFGNNPQTLINFLDDPKNRDEAVRLGLVNPKPAPQPDPVVEQLKELNSKIQTKKVEL